jgi:hypothetical protein
MLFKCKIVSIYILCVILDLNCPLRKSYIKYNFLAEIILFKLSIILIKFFKENLNKKCKQTITRECIIYK